MHDYSWTQLLKDNPEWATVIFSAVTVLIIFWQVVVMIVQGNRVNRRARQQNTLVRLQHEHDWLDALNVKREAILNVAEKLHIDVLFIIANHNANDNVVWDELLKLRTELKSRMEILDVAAYTRDKDGWYEKLAAWLAELFRIITEHFKAAQNVSADIPWTPTITTRKALELAEEKYVPVAPMAALQRSIRESTDEFKRKWDIETKV
jgi:hypothetical protein